MPAWYMKRFTVRGCGEFPVDMLRYDSCWPDTTEDGLKINRPHRIDSKERWQEWRRTPREVTLCTLHPYKDTPKPTEARWKSFGWAISKVEPSHRM